MPAMQSSVLLRRVLSLDACASGGMGLFALLFAAPVAGALNLPGDLIRQAGLVLLPFAAFVGYVASRPLPPRTAVWGIIGLNLVWIVESVTLLVAGGIEPNAMGYIVTIGQALAVAVLTELEYVGLRRVPSAAA